jgi:hypothetical protein
MYIYICVCERACVCAYMRVYVYLLMMMQIPTVDTPEPLLASPQAQWDVAVVSLQPLALTPLDWRN